LVRSNGTYLGGTLFVSESGDCFVSGEERFGVDLCTVLGFWGGICSFGCGVGDAHTSTPLAQESTGHEVGSSS
jgi:hypothetical protein